ncbi:MAG: N-acetylmuramoyl-L-alanine amidase [Abditibacteriales bacterium]|nr:N-acetylmuramoyl-L-alanine amidase [Abditibacteriales bacterium]MDW8367211.1 N-acetylmuramoyl-L-alanine amidase [Abditibacteriales bacterium]
MHRTFALCLALFTTLSGIALPAEAASSQSRKRTSTSSAVQRKSKKSQRSVKSSPRRRVASKAKPSKSRKLVQAKKSRPQSKATSKSRVAVKTFKPKATVSAPKPESSAKSASKPVFLKAPKTEDVQTNNPKLTAPSLTPTVAEAALVAPKSSDAPATDTKAEPATEPVATAPTPEPSKLTLTAAPQKVFVAGNEFALPAPAKLVKDELLAPLADALTQLGAKVEFRAEDKSLHIESAAGKRLSLYADNPNVIVDGRSETLSVAPTFDGARFLLPTIATAKMLGYALRTDRTGALHIYPTLTAVQVTPTEQAVEVKMILTAPVKYTHNTLQDTASKVYVDLVQTVLAIPPGEAWKGTGEVQRVRVGQFSSEPPIARVVMDMTRMLGYTVKVPERPNEVVIALSLAAMPPAPLPPMPNVVVEGDELKDVKIVVDAGHGGKDPGASSRNGTLEKFLTLDIALRLQECLMKRGATVLMTRTNDTYPTLAERVQLANGSQAHLFVSVHVNADARPGTQSGTMVLYATPHSLPLARSILSRLLQELQRPDKGIRYRPGLYVLRHTVMPSVIAEVAYLDHPEEEALLNDPHFRQRAAEAIALGVVDYVQQFRR